MKNMPKEKSKCHYCENEAEFTQPEKGTGVVIDVCKKHFTFMFMG
jgi:hypothetical protein